MWLPLTLLGLLAATLPLASAQNSSSAAAPTSNASPSPQVTVSTSFSTGVTIVATNGGRTEIATTATFLITSTIAPSTAAAPSDTAAASSSAASSTTTANLPTGSAAIVTDQAPSPGATGGAYGPDDSFINAAAHSLRRNSLLLGLGTAVVGGLLAA